MGSDEASEVVAALKRVRRALRAAREHRHAAVAGVYAASVPPPATTPPDGPRETIAGGGT